MQLSTPPREHSMSDMEPGRAGGDGAQTDEAGQESDDRVLLSEACSSLSSEQSVGVTLSAWTHTNIDRRVLLHACKAAVCASASASLTFFTEHSTELSPMAASRETNSTGAVPPISSTSLVGASAAWAVITTLV